ncbi:MAG: hypothetical protein QOD77_1196 [Thermoplasmata archaeon]|jgi:hypothetical protein|nr:hypothetical protein [Thermoplasmata archaeon]
MKAAATLALLLLAGCASAPASDEAPPLYTFARRVGDDGRDPVPCEAFGGHTVLVGVGTTLAAQPHRGVAPFDAVAQLVVPANTSALVLDLWWDQGAAAGLRSHVQGPGTDLMSDVQAAATEEAPLRLRIDSPAPGPWTWRALADPAAVGVVVHFQEGLYRLTPEQSGFGCNKAGA